MHLYSTNCNKTCIWFVIILNFGYFIRKQNKQMFYYNRTHVYMYGFVLFLDFSVVAATFLHACKLKKKKIWALFSLISLFPTCQTSVLLLNFFCSLYVWKIIIIIISLIWIISLLFLDKVFPLLFGGCSIYVWKKIIIIIISLIWLISLLFLDEVFLLLFGGVACTFEKKN